MAQPVLEMKGISKSFPGVKALDAVTLTVHPGRVHALMGENGAGKSTLMKCLFGIYTPDEGALKLEGQELSISAPKQALEQGIAMIHQEIHPVRDRTVMENVWLGRFPTKGYGPFRWVSHTEMRQKTKDLFQELGLSIDPDTIIGKLSLSEIQSIEIARAVSYRSRIIVMDEPTSSLTGHETDRLFKIIRDLRARGVAIIYISHKMEEILEIADDVSIMRDGRMMGTWPAGEMTVDLMISRMVGRTLNQLFPTKRPPGSEVYLRAEKLSAPSKGIKDISFDLRKGEVLGIGGLVGSRRTELVETLFGLHPMSEGRIFIGDREVSIHSPEDAIRNRLALLTEDRRATGIFPYLSVLENTVVAQQKAYRRKTGLLSESHRRSDAERVVKDLRVKTPSVSTLIRNLSGGNQQKVLLGRWLLVQPQILLLDEPTRGIDVGAKAEIYSLISQIASEGRSVIVVSSEMQELIGVSDRILVMCEGRVAGVIDSQDASEEKILRLATSFSSSS